MLTWEEFEKVDIRIGTIVAATMNTSVKKPAYLLQIDFGSLGIKKSSAQITDLYTPEDLLGLQVAAVVNFPPKQIGKIMSECLLLGAVSDTGVVILQTQRRTDNGLKVS
ncbi:MAG TPA: tRNA-binding protein [Cytophagales bacterium]|nr:tRNA-binding protein [Cytophagales bacterium]